MAKIAFALVSCLYTGKLADQIDSFQYQRLSKPFCNQSFFLYCT